MKRFLLQSLVSDRGEMQHAIKKGLLWQQRERLFSRWKERYFILTRDYLHCFKRSSGTDKISDMGQFIFKHPAEIVITRDYPERTPTATAQYTPLTPVMPIIIL
ncbi:hypothetical protein J6590_027647 [Homalodisca vitripennis]|nr:hypothetical protein J6590_027647 [Homalodisca vitripennis]